MELRLHLKEENNFFEIFFVGFHILDEIMTSKTTNSIHEYANANHYQWYVISYYKNIPITA